MLSARTSRQVALGAIPFGVAAILWAYSSSQESSLWASPLGVVQALAGEFASRDIVANIVDSVSRIAAGFALAVAAGVGLGFLMGYFATMNALCAGIIACLRPIPPIAWTPIAILGFGVGSGCAIFIVFIGAFFPILVNTAHGVKRIPVAHINAALSFGASFPQLLGGVLWPAALPEIFVGLRLGVAAGWTSVVAAEMIGAQSGLGYAIQMNRLMMDGDQVILHMAVIGVIGAGMSLAIGALAKRATPWISTEPAK